MKDNNNNNKSSEKIILRKIENRYKGRHHGSSRKKNLNWKAEDE